MSPNTNRQRTRTDMKWLNNAEKEQLNETEKKITTAELLREIDLEGLIDFAELFVRRHLLGASNHQLRRFFNVVKSIQGTGKFEAQQRAKLLMLRPQLANASAREKTQKEKPLQELKNICDKMIQRTKELDDFVNFANFFESLVAFHKAYGKTKN